MLRMNLSTKAINLLFALFRFVSFAGLLLKNEIFLLLDHLYVIVETDTQTCNIDYCFKQNQSKPASTCHNSRT